MTPWKSVKSTSPTQEETHSQFSSEDKNSHESSLWTNQGRHTPKTFWNQKKSTSVEQSTCSTDHSSSMAAILSHNNITRTTSTVSSPWEISNNPNQRKLPVNQLTLFIRFVTLCSSFRRSSIQWLWWRRRFLEQCLSSDSKTTEEGLLQMGWQSNLSPICRQVEHEDPRRCRPSIHHYIQFEWRYTTSVRATAKKLR